MAMNVNQAVIDTVAAVRIQLELDFITNGPVTSTTGLDGIANAIGEGVRVALQHVLDNAETSVGGESIL